MDKTIAELSIGNARRNLEVLEYHDERVITLRQMDELHGRPSGTAKRTFRKHRGKLLEGREYFEVEAAQVPQLGVGTYCVQTPNGGTPVSRRIILLSESGYLMLVKTFRDDLAWEVQRALINQYFRGRELRTPSEARLMRAIGTEIAAGIHEGLQQGLKPVVQRLDHLESNVDDVKDEMVKMRDEISSVVRRKTPTAATKRQHIDTLHWLGGKCPCCNQTEVVDCYGNRFDGAEWDHWYAPHRRAVGEVWLVCHQCNQAMKDQKLRASKQRYFDAFQLRREEHSYPLLPLQ